MKAILLACVSLSMLCASATVNYVVPWYANPVASDVAFESVSATAFDENAAMISTAWATVESADALGEAISAAAMNNLLAGVCAATEKPVKVYVDRRNVSWKTAAYIDRDCSRDADARAVTFAGERVLGVIRCGAPAPLGKALVIHLGSPYYKPSDFRLSIR